MDVLARWASCLALLTLAACSDSSEPQAAPAKSPPIIEAAAHIAVEHEDAFVFATEDSILVADERSLASVDPTTEAVRWQVDVPAFAAAGGFGSIWAADFEASVVRRIDPKDGRVVARVPVEGAPIGVVVAGDWVWTADHRGGTVSRIDPASNQVVGATPVGNAGTSGPSGLATDGNQVYVGVPNKGAVVRLDATTGEVDGEVLLPATLTPCGPLTLDGSVVWVTSCRDADRVGRVDFATGEAVASPALKAYAGGPGLVTDGAIWFPGVAALGGLDDALLALDPDTADLLAKVPTPGTVDASVAAFGSWWVVDEEGLARYDPSRLVP